MYASLKFDRRSRELSVECYEYPRAASIEYKLFRHNKIVDTVKVESGSKYTWNIDSASFAAGNYHVEASILDADLSGSS